MGRTQDLLAIIRSKPDHLVVRALDELLPRWIPVEDRLPEGECRCLVAVDGEVRSATYYPPGKFQPEITHWMPLPEPPPLAAPDLTPDAVAALREEWDRLHKGPRPETDVVITRVIRRR